MEGHTRQGVLSELPSLLTVTEVQELLRLSRAKVYRMMQQGEIPFIRIGRTVRVPRDRFLQWLEMLETTGSEN